MKIQKQEKRKSKISKNEHFRNHLKKCTKKNYKANTKNIAEENLLKPGEKWCIKYPVVIKSWEYNWGKLSTYFEYNPDIRKTIYTTNVVEGYHRQVRKVTKTKGGFTQAGIFGYKKYYKKMDLSNI